MPSFASEMLWPDVESIPVFKTKRPEGLKNHPLCDYFYYTKEPMNPWRCEMCARKADKEQADKQEEWSEQQLYATFDRAPGCCRKCGLDFER